MPVNNILFATKKSLINQINTSRGFLAEATQKPPLGKLEIEAKLQQFRDGSGSTEPVQRIFAG